MPSFSEIDAPGMLAANFKQQVAKDGNTMASSELEKSLRRGGNGWALNRLREDALNALLNDLSLRRASGFAANELYCEQVKAALDRVLSALEHRRSDAFWAGDLMAEFQQFRGDYHAWNLVAGFGEPAQKEREALTKSMRHRRRRIARKLRSHQRQVEIAAADPALGSVMLTPLSELSISLPDIFRNLHRVMLKVSARLRRTQPKASEVAELRPEAKGKERASGTGSTG